MTISTSTNKVVAQGNGATTAFSFAFLMPAAANAVVTVVDNLGNQTVQAATQYSLSGIGNANGGTLNYPLSGSPLPSGWTITLQRVLPLQQLTSLINQAGYFPAVVEGALDNLEMQVQQIAAVTGGNVSIQFPPADPLTLNSVLPPAAARAGSLLSFDSLGNVVASAPQSGTATSLAANLLNSVNATLGAAMVGFNSALAYAAGTVGYALLNAGNFLQAGIGAITRLIQTKLRESVSVDDFGAVGDNVTDDSAAIIAAQAALALRGGGYLNFTYGKNYRLVANPIPQTPGITYRGTGRSSVDNAPSQRGARIVSAVTDLFVNSGSLIAGTGFENLWIESEAGGGHIFNWSSAGIVAKTEMKGVTLVQGNAGKKVVNGTSAGGVFSLWMHDFEFRYMVANSVPAIHIASFAVNSIVIENYWALCTSGATSGTYAIWVESTNAAGAAFNVNIKKGVHEVPGGGAVQLLSCQQSCIEDCTVYDLAVTPNNPMFRIAKGSVGPASNNSSVRRLRSTVGTAGKPDLQIDMSVAGQSGFIVENCALSWYDGVSANGNGVLHINNGISNYENAAYTELGGSTGNDLRWISQSASGKAYAFWNGVPGNAEGYLNIFQAGAYAGAISPTGLFQWGGSRAAPAFYVGQTGVVNTLGPIFPGKDDGTGQLTAGIMAGAGAPNNANGLNGYYYFRSDTPGTANQRLYVRSAGAWVGIL